MNDKSSKAPALFDAIAIAVASPDQILSWSHGEVKKPETINYRTQKPERDGLFCERIFGPTKNWECACGKYKRVRYKGVICEKCGVEVTRSIVRRTRMGHIKLAVPVTHIWFLRSTPSRIGLLLNLPVKTLEQVVYFAAYIITEVDEKSKVDAIAQLEEEFKQYKSDIITELEEKKKLGTSTKEALEKEQAAKVTELVEQHEKAKEDLEFLQRGQVLTELEYRDMSMKFGHVFKAGTGAESLRQIISEINLDKEIGDLEKELEKSTGQKRTKLIKRIKLLGSLVKSGIKAEWMIMTTLPVIPPDLRPMVQLDGGRFAASDLNDLYRRVINRNNRLKRLIAIGAPEVICRNEKRMLQEAVDTLLNNSARQGKTVFNSGDKRKLRSLSDMLKGKQGRFRQNLLGKRVDYSGRSVIVVGPKLKLHQCGLPKAMAMELFKPFVIGKLISDGYAHNIKNAEKMIQTSDKVIWDILEDVTRNRYVLLNRAPTLHRLGIQAFQPVLIEGKAIQIHPLVCAAFNADFDGDQMAVHVPLSDMAQEEARTLMASVENLLKPSAGEPITTPAQDMVLGVYYLTKIHPNKKGEGKVFGNVEEAELAHQFGDVHLQAKVKIRIKGEIMETSLGRAIFNRIVPEKLGYQNKTFKKNDIIEIIGTAFENCSREETSKLCDDLKEIGFKYATLSGISIASSDMLVPEAKKKIMIEAEKVVNNLYENFNMGFMSEDERYHQVIKIWAQTKNLVAAEMIKSFEPENDIFYMIDSGARGNWGQITQLCGVKGLVANPAGKTIELPIKSNLKEGFTILEYFIATHGGRKGKSDTALKTAEAGYLTRRLVDAVQDIIIKETDCGTVKTHLVTRAESDEIGEAFEHRIFGRTVGEDLRDKNGKVLIKKGTEIDKSILKIITEHKVNEIRVRSVMTCLTLNGVCQKCYGRDLGSNNSVELGTAVGIIAAQSIGEPGTQLTMRTFHMGGVAEEEDITQGLTRVEELLEARSPKKPAMLAEVDGIAKITSKGHQVTISIHPTEIPQRTYEIPDGAEVMVKKGDKIDLKHVLAEKGKTKIRSEVAGEVMKAGKKEVVIQETMPEYDYKIDAGKTLKVKNGDLVAKGTPLTSGHINLRKLMKLTDIYTTQKYIMTEVQSIYASQGQTINDKHIEIITRQMFSKVRIVEPGTSNFLPGEVVDFQTVIEENAVFGKKKQPVIEYERLLLGLTRIALHTRSWLSAASFQETIRVLVEASTTHRIDTLEGLKENVIIGKLIPAGAIFRKRLAGKVIDDRED
ncbi:DNA-directed RNA polymerase subunit beta' [Candidatus Peregrinibacteria bacterium]|nr:DNA-directed RNA polymerase subunit beta' [Candidatus Peregrinibacteria bacterium]